MENWPVEQKLGVVLVVVVVIVCTCKVLLDMEYEKKLLTEE